MPQDVTIEEHRSAMASPNRFAFELISTQAESVGADSEIGRPFSDPNGCTSDDVLLAASEFDDFLKRKRR